MMQAHGLFARNLCCQRGERVLFAGLDLRLEAGAALRVEGANGVGKTSLIRLLAGLLPPSPIPGSPATEIRWHGSLGLVDDRLALDADLPLARALGHWARLDGLTTEEAAATCARVGLAGLEDVPVRYLSTGQAKRAALARLIGQRAEHWLLDEPLNGLDRAGVALVEALVAERRAAGGVVVIASHQPIALPDAQRLDLGACA